MANEPEAIFDEEAKADLEQIEIRLLTEGIYLHYGFDFRDYSLPSLRRRVWKRVYAEGLSTISGLLEKVLHDSQCMEAGASDYITKPIDAQQLVSLLRVWLYR